MTHKTFGLILDKDFERSNYKRLIRKLKNGDTLVIKSIDRVGRNYNEILEQWRIITKEKQAYIVVLDMPLLDTKQNRDQTGTLIADIVLQLLSYVAQTEREFIRQRQAEGIAAAKERGVQFGRRPMVRPEKYDILKLQWEADQISARAAAKQLGITHRTFWVWVREESGQKVQFNTHGYLQNISILAIINIFIILTHLCWRADCTFVTRL